MELYKILKAIDGEGTIVDNSDPTPYGGIYHFKNRYNEKDGLEHDGDEKRFKKILWDRVQYIGIRNGKFHIEL